MIRSSVALIVVSLIPLACVQSSGGELADTTESASSALGSVVCPSMAAAVGLDAYSLHGIDYVCSDFHGRIGAKESIELDGVGVQSAGLSISAGEDIGLYYGSASGDLEAHGDITLRHYATGAVFAGGWVHAASGSDLGEHPGVSSFVVDHAKVTSALLAASTCYAALAATSAPTHAASGALVFGATAGVNVFAVTASDVAGASGLVVSGPANAFVVINVSGAAVSFVAKSETLSGGIAPTNILYDVPAATQVDVSAIAFEGTLLAPLATVTFSNGHIDGALYVGDLDGNVGGAPTGSKLDCGVTAAGGQANHFPLAAY
jgi:choice-of-anchor A domain-containing protein